MRVCLTSPKAYGAAGVYGGAERYVANLGNFLATSAAVDDVRIVCASARDSVSQAGRVKQLACRTGTSGDVRKLASSRLFELIADCTVVHIHQPFTVFSEVVAMVAMYLDKPFFLTDHGGRQSLFGVKQGLYDHAHAVVCVSSFSADSLRQYFQASKVKVVPGGIELSEYEVSNREREPQCLFVGRLLPHKGIDRILKYIPSHWRLVICTSMVDEKYYQYLRSQCPQHLEMDVKLGLDDSQVRAEIAKSRCVILPSVHTDCFERYHPTPELMGFALLEAAAIGTPPVARAVGGMAEFVNHNETGYLFREDSELAGIFDELDTPARVQEIGGRAAAAIHDTFSMNKVGTTLLGLYQGA